MCLPIREASMVGRVLNGLRHCAEMQLIADKGGMTAHTAPPRHWDARIIFNGCGKRCIYDEHTPHPPYVYVLCVVVRMPRQTYDAIGDVVGKATAKSLAYMAGGNRKKLHDDRIFSCKGLAHPDESAEVVGSCYDGGAIKGGELQRQCLEMTLRPTLRQVCPQTAPLLPIVSRPSVVVLNGHVKYDHRHIYSSAARTHRMLRATSCHEMKEEYEL